MPSFPSTRPLALGCAAALTVFSVTATAQTTLLSDSFDRVAGNSDPGGGDFLSDWGSNDNASGGTLTQTYITTPTRTTGGGVNQTVQEADLALFGGDADNEGVIRFGAVTLDYDFSTDADVLAGGGFTVDFTFRRPSGFMTFWLGHDPNLVATTSGGAAFGPVTSANGASHVYLFQSDELGLGRMQLFSEGAQVDLNNDGMINDPPDSDNILNAFGQADLQYTASVTVDAPNGLDNGDDVTFSVAIDGNPIAAATRTVTLNNDFGGYIGWSSNAGGALVDDLLITAFAATAITGDYNADNSVDQGDLDLVLLNWGDDASVTGVPAGWVNQQPTGLIGQTELDGVLLNWGNTAEATVSAVPEPATAALLALGGLALTRRRNR